MNGTSRRSLPTTSKRHFTCAFAKSEAKQENQPRRLRIRVLSRNVRAKHQADPRRVQRCGMATMNPWEGRALQHQFSGPSKEAEDPATTWAASQIEPSTTFDKLIYPGLYSASGLDIMGILLWTLSRPNPTVNIGPVDASVPLILCDLRQADQPIVYASEPFLEMTGYTKSEIMGRNCRFLQSPGGKPRSTSPPRTDLDAVKRMRTAIQGNQEIQLEIDNFKKDGTKFRNMLTIIPVQWRSLEYTYSLGLQCEYSG